MTATASLQKTKALEANRRWYARNKPREQARKRVYMRAWRKKDPERLRVYQTAYRERNRGRYAALSRKRLTGWSAEAFEAAWKKQKGRCAICSVRMLRARGGRRAVHADHTTKGKRKVPRALLCACCNPGIALLKHNVLLLRKAIRYLKHWQG